MTTQPEALRLADELEKTKWQFPTAVLHEQSAAELRRLHSVNAELVEALRDFSAYVHAEQSATDGAVQYSNTQINRLAFKARAAIAKAEGRA